MKIEFEGVDGSGKSTALKYFVETLQSKDKKVLETREVGSPLIPINVKLRELVLSADSDLSGEAMELVFAAMRFENEKLYKKVKGEYDFIVSDRGWLSHLAYTDHNVSDQFTKDFYLDFVSKYTSMPDVVVYFLVDTKTALERRVKRAGVVDVIEAKGVEFQEKVRESFDNYIDDFLMNNDDVKIFVINANQDIDGVKHQMDQVIEILTGEKEYD
jgi:dTMP kinase